MTTDTDNHSMMAATGISADALRASILNELATMKEGGELFLATIRSAAADLATLADEGWHDLSESFAALEKAAIKAGHASTANVRRTLADAAPSFYRLAPIIAPLDAFDVESDPKQKLYVSASREMAGVINGDRLPTFQRIALTIGADVRSKTPSLNRPEAADFLFRLAESSGLAGDLRTDAIQHVIAMAFQGQAATIGGDVPMPRETRATGGDVHISPDLQIDRSDRRLIIRCASDIKPEPISWFWPDRIASGKLTLIAGQPGLGKSQLTAALAAATTTGGHWPCNEGRAPIGSVVVLSAEDDAADTQIPRLLAAGADCRRVHIISAVRQKDAKGNSTFNLAADLDLLEQELDRIGDVSLITIDPISSYLGKTDSHKNTEVRGVLELVSEMAARRRVAVIGVTHFNKGEGSAINKVIGSIAFVAASRAAFMVASDPDDETRRLFVGMKNNVGKPVAGLAFRVGQTLVGDSRDILAPFIAWDPEPLSDTTADKILSALSGKGDDARPANADAADFLSSVLADGPCPVEDIQREAVAAGLLKSGGTIGTDKTFRLARAKLGISRDAGTVYREGGTAEGGRWVWRLPMLPQTAYVAPTGNRGNLGEQGQLSSGGGS